MTEGVTALTDRERDVLRLLGAGHTAKSAAAELDLSVHTVNDYLREARKKVGVGSSREAARLLGEHETAPQNLTPEQLGMEDVAPPSEPASRSPRPRWIWAAGGSVMIAGIIALAMMAGGDHPVAEPTTETAVSTPAVYRAVEADARNWVALVDKAAWQQSWAAAGTAFRTAVTADQWTAQVDPVRSPLGAVNSRKLATIEAPGALPGAPEGDYRIARFATSYENAAGAVETVVLVKEDDEWKVVGYFIR